MDYTRFTPNTLKNKHLTLTERVKIELMLKDETACAISKALERPINTISNEIGRGTVDQIVKRQILANSNVKLFL